MNQLQIQRVAEGAILYALPTIKHSHTNSKMSNLQRKVRDIVAAWYLAETKQLTDREFSETLHKVNQWMNLTGWRSHPKALSTIISFIGIMMDESNFKYPYKLYKIIAEITDHLNNGNKYYHVSFKAGEIAKKKWDKIFNEED